MNITEAQAHLDRLLAVAQHDLVRMIVWDVDELDKDFTVELRDGDWDLVIRRPPPFSDRDVRVANLRAVVDHFKNGINGDFHISVIRADGKSIGSVALTPSDNPVDCLVDFPAFMRMPKTTKLLDHLLSIWG